MEPFSPCPEAPPRKKKKFNRKIKKFLIFYQKKAFLIFSHKKPPHFLASAPKVFP